MATCKVSTRITVTTLPGNFIFQTVHSLPWGSSKQRTSIFKQEALFSWTTASIIFMLKNASYALRVPVWGGRENKKIKRYAKIYWNSNSRHSHLSAASLGARYKSEQEALISHLCNPQDRGGILDCAGGGSQAEILSALGFGWESSYKSSQTWKRLPLTAPACYAPMTLD